MRIEHIAIWAKDITKLGSFYQQYFGATVGDEYRNESKGFSSRFVSFTDGAKLEIMNMPAIPDTEDNPYSQFTGLIHFAVSVGSEQSVNELTEQLVNDGFEVLDGPRHTGDGYYESVVLDPENNRVEITV